MNSKETSIEVFLNELASKNATPGGGSVAALMGAQAAALVSMVCRLTLGKPKYAPVETEMQDLLSQAENLREQLTLMVQADIEVFQQVMLAYALAKTTDAEKIARSAAIQTALQEATLVGLRCAVLCAEAIKLSKIATEKGNVGVVTDAGVAVMSAYAGLKSAALNVEVNAKSLKDSVFAQAQLTELETLLQNCENTVTEIYQHVKNKL